MAKQSVSVLKRERASWVKAGKHFRRLAVGRSKGEWLSGGPEFLCHWFKNASKEDASARERIHSTARRRHLSMGLAFWDMGAPGQRARAAYCTQKVKEIDRELAKLRGVSR